MGTHTTGVTLYTNGKQGKLIINIPSYTTTSPSHKLCDLPAAYVPSSYHKCPVVDSIDFLNACLSQSDTKVLLCSNALGGDNYSNLRNTIVYDLETPLY